MKDDEYILKMDAETAKIVSHACELYARILMGQFQVIQHLTLRPTGKGDPTFGERIDQCAEGLLQARKAAFPELGGWGHSYGVGHDRGADTAWHTYEVLRHTIAWHEHPKGGVTVDFDRPMRFSNAPMPECEVAGENAQEPVMPKEVNMYPLGQYACGSCGHISVGSKNYHAKYCPECGKAVKWDD